MDALRQGIYDALAANATLVAALGTYRSEYAIVDGYDIPIDMSLPAVQYEIISDVNRDTKSGRIRVVSVQFTVMTTTNDDPVTVAELVRAVFHRVAITVSGWTNIITEVNGPIQGAFDSNTKTSILSVDFTLA